MNCPIVKMAHLMQLVHSATANRENRERERKNKNKKNLLTTTAVWMLQKCWVSLQRCKGRQMGFSEMLVS